MDLCRLKRNGGTMEGRSGMGLNCLKKEQLIYELRIRGGFVEGSVPDLAARLHTCLDCPLLLTAETMGEVQLTF